MSGLEEFIRKSLREVVRDELSCADLNTGRSSWLQRCDIEKLLGIKSQTLSRLMREEGLPYHEVSGRKVVFREDEVDSWLDDRAYNNPRATGGNDGRL